MSQTVILKQFLRLKTVQAKNCRKKQREEQRQDSGHLTTSRHEFGARLGAMHPDNQGLVKQQYSDLLQVLDLKRIPMDECIEEWLRFQSYLQAPKEKTSVDALSSLVECACGKHALNIKSATQQQISVECVCGRTANLMTTEQVQFSCVNCTKQCTADVAWILSPFVRVLRTTTNICEHCAQEQTALVALSTVKYCTKTTASSTVSMTELMRCTSCSAGSSTMVIKQSEAVCTQCGYVKGLIEYSDFGSFAEQYGDDEKQENSRLQMYVDTFTPHTAGTVDASLNETMNRRKFQALATELKNLHVVPYGYYCNTLFPQLANVWEYTGFARNLQHTRWHVIVGGVIASTVHMLHAAQHERDAPNYEHLKTADTNTSVSRESSLDCPRQRAKRRRIQREKMQLREPPLIDFALGDDMVSKCIKKVVKTRRLAKLRTT